MKPSIKLPLALLLFALPHVAQAQTTLPEFEPRAIDAALQEALRFWHVPGAAVVIVRGDEVIYLKGHGVRELGSDRPVTPDTLFAIASLTKAFTATAIAILADDGKLAWDDRVRRHVEFFRLADPLADQN